MLRLALGVLLLAASQCAARADEVVTVKLAGGAQVTARLLQRNDDRVVLDLGHEVVTVDAKRVLSIGGPEHQPEEQTRQQDYYTVGQLEEAPVPELVKRYGDAVVTVTTPVGLGSGFVISREGHLITNYHVVEQSLKIKVTVFQRKQQGYEKL
jgi:serine protease Do